MQRPRNANCPFWSDPPEGAVLALLRVDFWLAMVVASFGNEIMETATALADIASVTSRPARRLLLYVDPRHAVKDKDFAIRFLNYSTDDILGKMKDIHLIVAVAKVMWQSDLLIEGVGVENQASWTLHLRYCRYVTAKKVKTRQTGRDNSSQKRMWISKEFNREDAGQECDRAIRCRRVASPKPPGFRVDKHQRLLLASSTSTQSVIKLELLQ